MSLRCRFFFAFISKTVNNQCYNPYISGKILSRAFQKCMGCSIDYLAIISKTVNNRCYNPYIFGKIFYKMCKGLWWGSVGVRGCWVVGGRRGGGGGGGRGSGGGSPQPPEASG